MKTLLALLLICARSALAAGGYANITGYGYVTWKAPVASAADLPTLGNSIGDCRLETTDFNGYAWNGTEWVEFGADGTGSVTNVTASNGAASSGGQTPNITVVYPNPSPSPSGEYVEATGTGYALGNPTPYPVPTPSPSGQYIQATGAGYQLANPTPYPVPSPSPSGRYLQATGTGYTLAVPNPYPVPSPSPSGDVLQATGSTYALVPTTSTPTASEIALWDASGNMAAVGSFYCTQTGTCLFTSNQASGGGDVVFEFNSANLDSGSGQRLVSFRNDNTEEAYIDVGGNTQVTSLSSSNYVKTGGYGAFLNATNGTHTAIIYANGHVKVQWTTAPTAAAQSAAGTGASCSLSHASDDLFVLSLTTGSASWGTGDQCDVTANQSWGLAPLCIIQQNDATTAAAWAALEPYLSTTTTKISLNFGAAAAGAATYTFVVRCQEPAS